MRGSLARSGALATEEQRHLADLDPELGHTGAVDQRVLVHQVHPVVHAHFVGRVADRQVQAITPVQGVASDLAVSHAYHIIRTPDPAPLARGREHPDATLAGAVAVQEALVKNQVVALAPADDIDLETLGNLTATLLKHPPGFDGLAEKALQIQCRLLIGITGDIHTAAAGDAERQYQ